MLLQEVICSFLLLVCSVSVGKAESFEASEEDEFSSLPDTSSRTEPAIGGASGTWEDDKVSFLGFLSLKWAEKNLELGTTEIFSVIVMVCYLLVYIRGRHRSYEIAGSFIRRVHGLFCSRFLEAGPASQVPPSDRRQLLARESPNSFLYYATGHRACDGVLMRISLIPRHDIFMLGWSMFSPVKDTVTLEVALDEGDMEPIVFAITRKRNAKKLLVDVPHIQDYAGVVRSPMLPSELACLAESLAHVECLLPPGAATLREYHDLLDLVHFTDQNVVAISGRTDVPKKVLRFRFRLEGDLRGAERMVELALTYLEFLHRFKMNSSMRKKALERRETIAKRKDKLTHAQRQERYQQLKNERLQREREEYDSLTPEQKRRRDLKDEKRAKKAANSRKPKMKMTKA